MTEKRLEIERECARCGRMFHPWRTVLGPGRPSGLGRFCSKTCARSKVSVMAQAGPTLKGLAWAAGFIDGEGCFTSSREPGRPVRSRIVVMQVERELLDRLRRFFGGHVYQRKASGKQPRPIYTWQVWGARARGVALTLYTWLSARRQAQVRQLLQAA